MFLALVSNQFVLAQFTQPLHIPDTIGGTQFDLTIAASEVSFLGGQATATYGINADYLAPTLIFWSGDSQDF